MGEALFQGKWVDVNTGDLETPVVWHVAKEFANTKSDDFFSPLPPLEALRLLLSHAKSGRSSNTGGRKILVVDARRAHLHAFAERNLYVAFLSEVRVPRNVCTTEAKFVRPSRRPREMESFFSQSSWRAWDSREGWPAHAAIDTAARI